MKLKTLALATSVALSAMAVAGPAQAGALATSVLDVTNFSITRGGTILNANTDFIAIVPANTADISASLNGTTIPGSISGNGQDLDLLPVCVGSGCPAFANNAYPVITAPPSSTFSAADQSQFGSPIANLPNPGGGFISTPATASHGAYVSLHGDPGDGSSTANNGLTAGFIFALAHGGAIDLAFNGRAYLEAATNTDAIFPTASSAAYNLTFTIRDLVTNTDIVVWKPDGSADIGSAAAFGLTAETDPFSLNDAVSRNAPFNGASFAGAALGVANNSGFSATTVNLLENHQYQLTIRSSAEADARKAVPEPATLALMGLGILGLGLSRRRRA